MSLKFAIHGVGGAEPDDIEVDVFADKLASVVRALRAADRAMNGKQSYRYVVRKLHSSTPTVIIAETRIADQSTIMKASSGISGFMECAGAIISGNEGRAREFGNCAKYIRNLSGNSRKKYSYAEISHDDEFIRIDPFLAERATRMLENKPEPISPESGGWYKGASYGSFYGVVKEVDLRGMSPQFKLAVNENGPFLDCVSASKEVDVEAIKRVLDVRGKVTGNAFYDGTSPLPRRIQVFDISKIGGGTDFSKWKGAFDSFEPDGWLEEDV